MGGTNIHSYLRVKNGEVSQTQPCCMDVFSFLQTLCTAKGALGAVHISVHSLLAAWLSEIRNLDNQIVWTFYRHLKGTPTVHAAFARGHSGATSRTILATGVWLKGTIQQYGVSNLSTRNVFIIN